jgi:hypothetical protein
MMRLLRSLKARLRPRRGSELDHVIPAEIAGDRLCELLEQLAARAEVRHILEIGSSSGEGSTAALARGARRNPSRPELHCMEVSAPRFEQLAARYREDEFVHCHRRSSVPLERFPTRADVERFWRDVPSRLHRTPLSEVLRWLEQDLVYVREHGLSGEGIRDIRDAHRIDRFDLVLIDGSEFTGTAELDEVYGARFLALDDVCSFKNFENCERLKGDPSYRLVEESARLRNGFAVFERT